MPTPEDPRVQRFRGSATAIRLGAAILAVIILAYATIITAARLKGLDSTRDHVVLGVVWAVALIALVLLARAWKGAKRRTER